MIKSGIQRVSEPISYHLTHKRHTLINPTIRRAFSSQHPLRTGDSPRPTGLKSTTGIELLTFGTPNGHKASIVLEELVAAYPSTVKYSFQAIDISENIQKEPWFTALCPNGRIPVIIDHNRRSFPVFEGAAILSYLTRHYDSERKLSFDADREPNFYSEAEQWIAFQHGGVGPMQGQANHFFRLAKERIPYPTQRYVGETERLYGVLDTRLKGREWLAGDRFSIADIANFSWVNVAYFAGVDLTMFPHLEAWWKRVTRREAVQKGISVPAESRLVNEAYLERIKEDAEFSGKEKLLKDLAKQAKEQYGYRFASP